jgi:hypothetical protein
MKVKFAQGQKVWFEGSPAIVVDADFHNGELVYICQVEGRTGQDWANESQIKVRS